MRLLLPLTIAALLAAVALVPPGPVPLPLASAQPPATELPPDLALVPADALGFVHVRAAELWKRDVFAPFRQTFEKAGPKVLAALDEQFVPKVSTFDRVTGVLMVGSENREPLPLLVLRFREPFDPDAVIKAYRTGPETLTLNGKTAYRAGDFGFYLPDKQHIVFGPPPAVIAHLKHTFPKDGPLSAGLKLAASGQPLVASLDIAGLPIPPRELEQVPADIRPLLKARHLTAFLDLEKDAVVRFTLAYKTAEDAQAAEKAVKALADFLRKEWVGMRDRLEKEFLQAKGPRPAGDLPEALLSVFAIGALNRVDELLADPSAFVQRDGANLTASLPIPRDIVTAAAPAVTTLVSLLLPAVQKVREAANRLQDQNNLKQIMLAIHSYADAHGHLPHDIVDKNGKPLLSWRVQILPYIEQETLFKQFKLDEPWDSPNNLRASRVDVKMFLSPRFPPPKQPGLTHYQGFVGPGTLFETGKKIRFTDITDGTSNTLAVIETAEAVEWAKPGGLPFDPKKPLPKLTPGDDGVINAAMADGSVRAIHLARLKEDVLKALITRAGGEVPPDDR